jgi:homoserine kinase
VIWSERPVLVRAPATCANLGPGFDALGLALALHDRVEASVAGAGLTVEVAGQGAGAAGLGEEHLVVRAMRAAFDVLGGQPPGLRLRCANVIPQGRGLGSSAAAIVSGLLAARALVAGGAARLPDDGVLPLAAGLEGHPDNVAACLAGGLTIAWRPGRPEGPHGLAVAAPGSPADPGNRAVRGGDARLLRLDVAATLTTVVCVPPFGVPTSEARRVLPASVPHTDAAANAGRSALLVAALTSEPAALFDATEDFLHQKYRAEVMPATAGLLNRLRRAGVAAVVSGAGPAVLALLEAGQPPGPETVGSIARETGIAWHVTPLDIDRQGAAVQPGGLEEYPPDIGRQRRSWDQAQDRGMPTGGGSPQGQPVFP